MKTSRVPFAAALVAALLVAAGAAAHGPVAAKHGGIAKEAEEIGYELVATPDGAELYLEDHDEPLATAGFTGTLVVTAGGAERSASLQPAGGNKLVATGVKIASGAKVVVTLKGPDGTSRAVRFRVP